MDTLLTPELEEKNERRIALISKKFDGKELTLSEESEIESLGREISDYLDKNFPQIDPERKEELEKLYTRIKAGEDIRSIAENPPQH